MTISALKQDILYSLGHLYFLTNRQVHRRFTSDESYARRIMRELARDGFIFPIDLSDKRGQPERVWGLSKARGWPYVEAMGISAPVRWNEDELVLVSAEHMRHTLAINDVLIALELLHATHTDIELVEYYHERTMRGMGLGVIPDAWARIRTPQGTYGLLLEIDRATEKQEQIRQKVHRLVALIDSGTYGRVFDDEYLPRIWFVVPDNLRYRKVADRHVEVLATWIGQAVSELLRPEYNDVFEIMTLVSATDPEFLIQNL